MSDSNDSVQVIEYSAWPLKRGETLSNHDWFPFYGHRFLASSFVLKSTMTGNRAHIGTAMILMAEAMRQDPAGTLPICDVDLASMARFSSVDEWLACKEGVLHGWSEVYVEDAATGDASPRLGHMGFLAQVAGDMFKRKRGRDAARTAGNEAVRRSRIKKKMEVMRLPDHMTNDQVVHALAEHFKHSDLYITDANVRTALFEVIGWNGDVVPLTGARRKR